MVQLVGILPHERTHLTCKYHPIIKIRWSYDWLTSNLILSVLVRWNLYIESGPRAATAMALEWCHNEHDGISNKWRLDCLLNCLFKHRSKKASKLRITGLCEGNSPVTGEFPAQRASNAENVSIWWRHHGIGLVLPSAPEGLSCYKQSLSSAV